VVDVRVREANSAAITYEKRACDRQVFLARVAVGIFKSMAEQPIEFKEVTITFNDKTKLPNNLVAVVTQHR
jgi:hypothetical protein